MQGYNTGRAGDTILLPAAVGKSRRKLFLFGVARNPCRELFYSVWGKRADFGRGGDGRRRAGLLAEHHPFARAKLIASPLDLGEQ